MICVSVEPNHPSLMANFSGPLLNISSLMKTHTLLSFLSLGPDGEMALVPCEGGGERVTIMEQ